MKKGNNDEQFNDMRESMGNIYKELFINGTQHSEEEKKELKRKLIELRTKMKKHITVNNAFNSDFIEKRGGKGK